MTYEFLFKSAFMPNELQSNRISWAYKTFVLGEKKLMGHEYSLKSIHGYIKLVVYEFHW